MRVAERVFLGDRIRVTGETAQGERIAIELDNATALADGDIIPISFDVAKLHFLPRS